MKSEKELREIYKKYIDVPLYRTVALRDLKNIKRKGLDPAKNPYKKIKGKLINLFNLVRILESKGLIMKFQMGRRESTGGYYASMAKHEINRKMIDFTPVREHYSYYRGLKGGAMVACVKRLTKRLIENKDWLNKEQLSLVRELNKWAEKSYCKMGLIEIRGSLKSLKNAHFQLTGIVKGKVRKVHFVAYYESPFGSFEHFKRVIERNGLRKYASRLKNGKFYLRVRDKIPKEEIKRLK